MGTLIIESSKENKYRDLKKSLINRMTQGHNHYPTRKAAAYAILCKYVTERPKSKNELTETGDRPVTGVSFYRRATPVDGPPVSGEMSLLKK